MSSGKVIQKALTLNKAQVVPIQDVIYMQKILQTIKQTKYEGEQEYHDNFSKRLDIQGIKVNQNPEVVFDSLLRKSASNNSSRSSSFNFEDTISQFQI